MPGSESTRPSHSMAHMPPPAIDLVMAEVRSDLGVNAFNELVDEFDLELMYNIAPMESDHSNS